MILDIAEIKKLALEREKENLRFRNFLKEHKKKYIDRLVHELNDYYTAEIDCTLCGNCCTCLRPILAESDIDRLIKYLSVTRANFKKKYVQVDRDGDMLLKQLPCAFFKNNKCRVYDYRPEDCQSYPHLYKKDFSSRLFGILENYAICPIVFNVIEELKLRLNFS